METLRDTTVAFRRARYVEGWDGEVSDESDDGSLGWGVAVEEGKDSEVQPSVPIAALEPVEPPCLCRRCNYAPLS